MLVINFVKVACSPNLISTKKNIKYCTTSILPTSTTSFSLSSAPFYKPFYPDNAANHWFVARFSVFIYLNKNRPGVCAFRPNWRETAAQSSSLRRTLQAFLSKAAPVCVFGRAGVVIIIQPLHAKFLLCHDGFIRWVVDLLAVDRIFYRQGSTLLIYKESFSFFSRFFQILSVLCRTDTILFLEYPAKIEWVIIPYDLCDFSNIVFGVLQ